MFYVLPATAETKCWDFFPPAFPLFVVVNFSFLLFVFKKQTSSSLKFFHFFVQSIVSIPIVLANELTSVSPYIIMLWSFSHWSNQKLGPQKRKYSWECVGGINGTEQATQNSLELCWLDVWLQIYEGARHVVTENSFRGVRGLLTHNIGFIRLC